MFTIETKRKQKLKGIPMNRMKMKEAFEVFKKMRKKCMLLLALKDAVNSPTLNEIRNLLQKQ